MRCSDLCLTRTESCLGINVYQRTFRSKRARRRAGLLCDVIAVLHLSTRSLIQEEADVCFQGGSWFVLRQLELPAGNRYSSKVNRTFVGFGDKSCGL